MKILHLARNLFATTLLALAASAPAHATLTGAYNTLYFSGTCTDCSGSVAANLNLSNYTIGKVMLASQFWGFSYGGSNLLPAFVIDGDAQPNTHLGFSIIQGDGSGTFSVQDAVHYFRVNSGGAWDVGLVVPAPPPCSSCGGGGGSGRASADFGINGLFSATPMSLPPPQPPSGPGAGTDLPEPGSAFLLFLGFSAMAVAHRQRRRRSGP